LLNGIALLGWNPPQVEDEETGSFKGSEVFSMSEMIDAFSMDKISKSGAKFSIEKLEYFNSQHITKSFSYSNDSEKIGALDTWRQMLLKEMPERLHS
jgi:glutamyl/glutaminyl-tRNA synthetase